MKYKDSGVKISRRKMLLWTCGGVAVASNIVLFGWKWLSNPSRKIVQLIIPAPIEFDFTGPFTTRQQLVHENNRKSNSWIEVKSMRFGRQMFDEFIVEFAFNGKPDLNKNIEVVVTTTDSKGKDHIIRYDQYDHRPDKIDWSNPEVAAIATKNGINRFATFSKDVSLELPVPQNDIMRLKLSFTASLQPPPVVPPIIDFVNKQSTK